MVYAQKETAGHLGPHMTSGSSVTTLPVCSYSGFCSQRCLLIALAFELQIVEHVPCADHDIHMHKIVTEKRVIDCPSTCLLR